MKNMNLFRVLMDRGRTFFVMMTFFLMCGLSLNAQSTTAIGPSTVQLAYGEGLINETNVQNYIAKHIQYVTGMQSLFTPGTAKYDICQDAINYLNSRATFFTANTEDNGAIQTTFTHEKVVKANHNILDNYNVSEISQFQNDLGNAGLNPLRQTKLQYILDANAY